MPMRHILPVTLNKQDNKNPYFAASYVGESEGHWHIVEEVPKLRRNPYFTSSFNVYEVARDYSGWFVKYQVDLNAISSVFPEIIKYRYNRCIGYTLNILSLVRSGKEEEEDGSFLVVEIPGGKVVCYNFMDKSVEKLWEFTPIGYKFYDEDGLRRDCVSAFHTLSLLLVCDYWCLL